MIEHQYARWYNRAGVSPAQQMGELLAGYRRDGLSFYEAWPLALERVEFENGRQRIEWLRAWSDPNIRDGWWDGFDGREHPGTVAVTALEEMHELVGLPDPRSDAELRQPPVFLAAAGGRSTGEGWQW